MDESKKCPNCGQYTVQRMNLITLLIMTTSILPVFIITLPLELIFLPVTFIALFVPAAWKKHAWCSKCHWSDMAKSAPTPN